MDSSTTLHKTLVLMAVVFLALPLFCGGSTQADATVTVSSTTVGSNKLQAGFALDGEDISYWRTSTTAQSYAKTNNYKFTRFFDHRLGNPCYDWDENTKTGQWDWSKYDDLISDLVAVGIEPIICLGYYSDYGSNDFLSSAPRGMTRNWQNTHLPNPAQYAEYAKCWVDHFPQVTYYELVNEPYKYFGWGGSNSERLSYFKTFFNTVVTKMREADGTIKVGNDASMMPQGVDLTEWMAKNLVDLDFLSWHPYLSGNIRLSDSDLIYNAQFDEGGTCGGNNFINPARQKYFNIKGIWLNCIATEENLSWDWQPTDPRCRQILNVVTESLRYRTYILNGHVTGSIIWHFGGKDTCAFGMVNKYSNYRYYPYWTHNMIFSDEVGALSVGDSVLTSSSSSDNVVPLAWRHAGKTTILLIHKSTGTKTSVALSGVTGTYDKWTLDWTKEELQQGTQDVSQEFELNGYGITLLKQQQTSTVQPVIDTPIDDLLDSPVDNTPSVIRINIWHIIFGVAVIIGVGIYLKPDKRRR